MIKIISRGKKNGQETAQIVILHNGKSQTRHTQWSRQHDAYVDKYFTAFKSVEYPK